MERRVKLKRRQLDDLAATLVLMVRRACRELDPKIAAALLADLERLLDSAGWREP